MGVHVFYLNLIKFLTVALVLGFTVYVSNANEVVMDIDPFPVCIECMNENSGVDPTDLPSENELAPSVSSADQQKTVAVNNGMISVAVLNPDLTDFAAVSFAIVEVADLEIAAEYSSYSLKDINHDDKTDMVFYFLARDLMPPHPASEEKVHDACLFVDILKTDKTTSNYSICQHSLFLPQDKI